MEDTWKTSQQYNHKGNETWNHEIPLDTSGMSKMESPQNLRKLLRGLDVVFILIVVIISQMLYIF